jgi:hypothetical protein
VTNRVRIALLGGLAALAFGVSHLVRGEAQALRAQLKDDAHLWVPSPSAARFLSAGYNEVWADLFWARTLIYYGDGLVEKHGMPDLDRLLSAINALDPYFRRPYSWGGHATTFRAGQPTQEEFRSSVAVLERGLAAFPLDWEMSWTLGLRLFFDVRDPDPRKQERLREEGVAHIERAMRLPNAPPDLPILAAAMRTRLGQRERALKQLREMILSTDDEAARAQLKSRYAELVTEGESLNLDREAERSRREWELHMPHVTRPFYDIVGPPPGDAYDLAAIWQGERFDTDAETP